MIRWDDDDQPWRAEAACAGMGPDIFFPPPGGGFQTARAICYRCPVQVDCLRYAMRTEQRHGIWGGRSFEARAQRRQSRLTGKAGS